MLLKEKKKNLLQNAKQSNKNINRRSFKYKNSE